jgi:hypothetical protein
MYSGKITTEDENSRHIELCRFAKLEVVIITTHKPLQGFFKIKQMSQETYIVLLHTTQTLSITPDKMQNSLLIYIIGSCIVLVLNANDILWSYRRSEGAGIVQSV